MISNVHPLDGHTAGNILAALCKTENTGEFHWLIYLCEGERKGTRFHAHNKENTEKWQYQCKEWDVLDSGACVAVTKIGQLPAGMTAKDIDVLLERIPLTVPDVDRPRFHDRFTCLVWFRAAIRMLHIARILGVTDLDLLEDSLRVKATGVQYANVMRQRQGPAIMQPSDYTY